MRVYLFGTRILSLVILLIGFTNLFSRTVSGIVLDRVSGTPVSYISVYEKYTNSSALTGDDGRFSIEIPQDSKVEISFTHISYDTQLLALCPSINDAVVQVFIKERLNSLKDVEVLATSTRQVVTQSYSQTNLNEEFIQEKIATSLIDVLEQAPGITKRGEYYSPIVLRGLGGKRLLVTKDGNRRMGNFSGGFMGQGINIYDLEKVEVIKGPASVKYGSGAITGIINMLSKYPFLTPGWHGRFSSSYGTNNNEKLVLGGLNWANIDNAFSFSARLRDADDYVAGKNTPTENSAYKDKDLRASYSYEGNNALMLTVESELHLGGPWGRPVGFNGTDYMRVYNKTDNTWHSSATAVWKPEELLKRLELSVYYDQEYRNQIKDSYDVGSSDLSYREDISYRNYYVGWRGLAVLTKSKSTEISIGTDGVYYRIESPTVLTDYFLNTTINNKVTKDAGVSLTGLFTEMEYARTNRLKFRMGLRGDYSHINEGIVHDTLRTEGRVSDVWAWNATSGVVYTAWPAVFLSFQAARSCRMPDATEMFIETSNTDGIVYGNPDLKPEYGLNFDAGLRGVAHDVSFDCSLFANFLQDFISLEYWKNSGKRGVNYTYMNIDKARIMGAEVSLGARFRNIFQTDNTLVYNSTYVLTFGDKLTHTPDWFSEGDPLRNIPPFNTTQELTLRHLINSSKSFYIGADARYYATQNRIASSADGGYVSYSYALFGVSAGYTYKKYSKTWELKLKADNLADNYYRPFESLSYSMGRNFKIMGVFRF